jgi:Tfp pilus assembly protein FimT
MRRATAQRNGTPAAARPRTVASVHRPGSTLVELLAALVVLALLAAAGARAIAAVADGAAARAAGAELRSAFASARAEAVRRGARTAVRLDSASAQAVVHTGPDTLRRLRLGHDYGVRLRATRDSMAYTALGIGYGGANLRAVLTRGHAVDTVTVSRLGRVR